MKCGKCQTELVCPCCSVTHSHELVHVDNHVEKPKRGARLVANWMPTQAVIDTMKAEFPSLTRDWFRSQHRQFIDYWIAQPGQKGVKLDWNATWRNWIRRAAQGHNGSRNGTMSTVDAKVAGWMELGRD